MIMRHRKLYCYSQFHCRVPHEGLFNKFYTGPTQRFTPPSTFYMQIKFYLNSTPFVNNNKNTSNCTPCLCLKYNAEAEVKNILIEHNLCTVISTMNFFSVFTTLSNFSRLPFRFTIYFYDPFYVLFEVFGTFPVLTRPCIGAKKQKGDRKD